MLQAATRIALLAISLPESAVAAAVVAAATAAWSKRSISESDTGEGGRQALMKG